MCTAQGIWLFLNAIEPQAVRWHYCCQETCPTGAVLQHNYIHWIDPKSLSNRGSGRARQCQRGSAQICFTMTEGDTLFGYPIPFPQHDLIVAVVAVCAFLPAVVIVHTVIAKIFGVITKQKTH